MLLQCGSEANAPPPESESKQRGRKNTDEPAGSRRDAGIHAGFPRVLRISLVERDVRMMQVKRNTSGIFGARSGAEAFSAIRSYISSARKQGYGAVTAVHVGLLGNPFNPAAHGAE